jgi:hypothetical protein
VTRSGSAFSEERDSLGKAGMLDADDGAATERLNALSDTYEQAVPEVKSLEDLLERLGSAPSIRNDLLGVQEKAWARGTVGRLIEWKAIDATSGGTIPHRS